MLLDKFSSVSLNLVGLYVNIAVDEVLQDICKKLGNEEALAERIAWQAEASMDLMKVYFRDFVQQKDDIIMWSSLSPTWRTSRIWPLIRHNINHRYRSVTFMTHLWSRFMIQSSYRISSSTTRV